MTFSGVFPVYNILFKIGTKGLLSTAADMATVADMESFSIKMSGKAETWIPMTTQGWERNLITSKGFAITLKGKRSVGDPGNDYVAKTAWTAGLSCSTIAEIDFPDGSKLNFNCVIDVTNPGGDSSEKVTPLEFDLKSDGAPTYTPAPAGTINPIALSSSSPANNDIGVVATVQPALTFNNVIASYANVLLMDSTDDALMTNTMALDGTKKILTIAPSANLLSGKTYNIILTGVTDIYGQVLTSQIIKFTVA